MVIAFPELRCTFGGRSLVPDATVFFWERIPCDASGELVSRRSRTEYKLVLERTTLHTGVTAEYILVPGRDNLAESLTIPYKHLLDTRPASYKF